MNLAEIEAQLDKLDVEELRALTLKSWTVFTRKERRTPSANQCSEEDLRLLAALDEAIAQANSTQGHSAAAIRQRLKTWTSKLWDGRQENDPVV